MKIYVALKNHLIDLRILTEEYSTGFFQIDFLDISNLLFNF